MVKVAYEPEGGEEDDLGTSGTDCSIDSAAFPELINKGRGSDYMLDEVNFTCRIPSLKFIWRILVENT